MKIGVVSGGFDPLHSGHIKYINSAKKFSDYLIVLLNSDDWLIKKKGKNFLPFYERKTILENIESVDKVLAFTDDNKMSVIHGLKKIKKMFPNDEIIFCNGGDRTENNIPEMELEGIKFRFRVGGSTKLNSSSEILSAWEGKKIRRKWGYYKVLQTSKDVKLKELIINKKSGLSFQKHNFRNELWFIREGSLEMITSSSTNSRKKLVKLFKHDFFIIKQGQWHQAINNNDKPCSVYEIQFGKYVIEKDIERLFYYN